MFNFKISLDREAEPDNWEFGLSGFRSFHDKEEFEFSQVSFITGGNHTGKSTILRALSVLLDTLKGGGFVLRLDGRNGLMHQIPSLEQLVPWGVGEDEDHEIKFSITIKNIHLELVFQRISKVNEAWLTAASIFFRDEKKPVKLVSLFWAKSKSGVPVKKEDLNWRLQIHKLLFHDWSEDRELSAQDRFVHLLNSHSKGEENASSLENWFSEFDRDGRSVAGNYVSTTIKGFASFSGLRNKLAMLWVNRVSDKSLEESRREDASFWVAAQVLDGFINSLPVMRHLGSQRDVAPRVATVGTSPYRIFGEVRQQMIHGMFEKGGGFMRHWMAELNIGEDFEIQQVGGLGYSVRLKKKSGLDSRESWCNLADLSMGEAQIFRILLTLAQAINEIGDTKKWVICVLEEPDSNLHPSTQSSLLDALVAAGNESRHLQIFMETHSEILVRSLQLKVKDKQLRREAVVINYLEDREVSDGDHRRITLDEKGRTSSEFGSGFIDESGELAIRLL